jgi:TctA family transporter
MGTDSAVLQSFQNVRPPERLVRSALGAVLLGLGLAGALPGLGSTAALLLGWVPLVTGLIGWCPLYAVLRAGSHRS